MRLGCLSEFGTVTRLVLKHARDAFRSQDAIDTEWPSLAFSARPDFARALDEYERFLHVLQSTVAACDLHYLPSAPGVGLDSIYVRDAAVTCGRGVILGAMGKPERGAEPAAQEAELRRSGIPIAGAIRPPGRLEGGDVVWLDARTVVVGHGYRTNDAGIRQLRELLGETIDELHVVGLPHWRGPRDVFHLMSILSPVDRDLAVVYSPLMPVPLRGLLLARGMTLVEVPEEEFQSLGSNVLAMAPRRCVMLEGNPQTRNRLEHAGAAVLVYRGDEISLKGGGGPTCLTRPIARGMCDPRHGLGNAS